MSRWDISEEGTLSAEHSSSRRKSRPEKSMTRMKVHPSKFFSIPIPNHILWKDPIDDSLRESKANPDGDCYSRPGYLVKAIMDRFPKHHSLRTKETGRILDPQARSAIPGQAVTVGKRKYTLSKCGHSRPSL